MSICVCKCLFVLWNLRIEPLALTHTRKKQKPFTIATQRKINNESAIFLSVCVCGCVGVEFRSIVSQTHAYPSAYRCMTGDLTHTAPELCWCWVAANSCLHKHKRNGLVTSWASGNRKCESMRPLMNHSVGSNFSNIGSVCVLTARRNS